MVPHTSILFLHLFILYHQLPFSKVFFCIINTHPPNNIPVMCSVSSFSNPPLPSRQSSPKLPVNHHSPGSHVKWSTPLTQTRVIPASEYDSASAEANILQYPSKHNDVGTIAGAMQGLDLKPTASNASSTSLQVTPQPTFHPSSLSYPQLVTAGSASQAISQSYPQSTIPNPNLRFIAAHYQAHNRPDKRSVNTPTGVFKSSSIFIDISL